MTMTTNPTPPLTIETAPLEQILESKALHFVDGLPGFPHDHRFVMAQRPEERPFAWMHSLDHPALKFAVVDAYAWQFNFTLEIDDDELARLGSTDPREYAVYFICRIETTTAGTFMKANTQAPLLVNVRSREARQLILSQPEVDEGPCLRL